MTNHRFATGAFVFTRARGILPRHPDELAQLASNYNIDSEVIPSYPGDRIAISRGVTQTSKGLHREGFLLRPIKRSSSEVIFGIVREEKDEKGRRLSLDHEATVTWRAEPDPSNVEGEHPVARRVADKYQELRGKVIAEDWSASITSYLEQHDAARVRGDGRVFWVPPQRINEIRNLGTFLQQVGVDLVMCELEPEVTRMVQDVASESIEEQLEKLSVEAESFDGTQRPSTYVRRLEEYQRLKNRATLYRDALGVGVEKAEQILEGLERQVTDMLELRKQTVIRKKSDREKPLPREAEEAPATDTSPTPSTVPSLQFAGSTFIPATSDEPDTLLFTSGEEFARASVASLESLGLTGKWQPAGSLQVSIQNSGPPGAEVSIRVRCPSPGALMNAASSLANLGICISN